MKHITMTHQMSSTYKIYAMLHLKVMLKYLIKIEYKLRSGKIIIIITRNLPSIRDAHILFILYLKTNMIFTNYNYHNTTDMQACSKQLVFRNHEFMGKVTHQMRASKASFCCCASLPTPSQ